MSKGIPILVLVMLGSAGALTWGSMRGLGVPHPMKKPFSLREGSVRTTGARSRYRRRRYFVGGGMHGGK